MTRIKLEYFFRRITKPNIVYYLILFTCISWFFVEISLTLIERYKNTDTYILKQKIEKTLPSEININNVSTDKLLKLESEIDVFYKKHFPSFESDVKDTYFAVKKEFKRRLISTNLNAKDFGALLNVVFNGWGNNYRLYYSPDYNEVKKDELKNIIKNGMITLEKTNGSSDSIPILLFLGHSYYTNYFVENNELATTLLKKAWLLGSIDAAEELSFFYNKFDEPEKAYFWSVRSENINRDAEKRLKLDTVNNLKKLAKQKEVVDF